MSSVTPRELPRAICTKRRLKVHAPPSVGPNRRHGDLTCTKPVTRMLQIGWKSRYIAHVDGRLVCSPKFLEVHTTLLVTQIKTLPCRCVALELNSNRHGHFELRWAQSSHAPRKTQRKQLSAGPAVLLSSHLPSVNSAPILTIGCAANDTENLEYCPFLHWEGRWTHPTFEYFSISQALPVSEHGVFPLGVPSKPSNGGRSNCFKKHRNRNGCVA